MNRAIAQDQIKALGLAVSPAGIISAKGYDYGTLQNTDLHTMDNRFIPLDDVDHLSWVAEEHEMRAIMKDGTEERIHADVYTQKDAEMIELRMMPTSAIELEDIASSLGEYLSSISFSEDELEEKSARLALLQRLKKKYGGSLEAVVSRRDEYRSALSTIENFEDLLAESGRRVEKAERELMRTGEALSAHRGSCARSLEKTIQGNLASLGLKSAVFRIVITRRQAEANGMDDVVFTLAANKGEKEGPVSQVASGGELSRIMLAIKSALTAEDEVETLLFDEIDSGLGGVVANSVAMELDKLSRSHQVIAITHLAQIAAKARTHYMVYKREEAGRTISSIEEISGEDRVDEIARLLSGEVSGISRQHAASLLSQ